jgi:hypothetical protein
MAGHRADDIVNNEGMTRLEAAIAERSSVIQAEMNKHRDNTDAELSRHRNALAHIDNVFQLRLSIA